MVVRAPDTMATAVPPVKVIGEMMALALLHVVVACEDVMAQEELEPDAAGEAASKVALDPNSQMLMDFVAWAVTVTVRASMQTALLEAEHLVELEMALVPRAVVAARARPL